jgi:hypothetical protein
MGYDCQLFVDNEITLENIADIKTGAATQISQLAEQILLDLLEFLSLS